MGSRSGRRTATLMNWCVMVKVKVMVRICVKVIVRVRLGFRVQRSVKGDGFG